MTPKELLVAARDSIADPKCWCRGTLARSKAGNPVKPWSEEAVSWCAIGAFRRFSDGSNYTTTEVDVYHALNDAAFNCIEGVLAGCAENFNDSFTHKETMEMYDYAIRKVSGETGLREVEIPSVATVKEKKS